MAYGHKRGHGDFQKLFNLTYMSYVFIVMQVRIWMKSIYELLLESEQLRLETDDAGPQVIIMINGDYDDYDKK